MPSLRDAPLGHRRYSKKVIETYLNDLLQLALESRISSWGWSVKDQTRKGFSPSEKDLGEKIAIQGRRSHESVKKTLSKTKACHCAATIAVERNNSNRSYTDHWVSAGTQEGMPTGSYIEFQKGVAFQRTHYEYKFISNGTLLTTFTATDDRRDQDSDGTFTRSGCTFSPAFEVSVYNDMRYKVLQVNASNCSFE